MPTFPKKGSRRVSVSPSAGIDLQVTMRTALTSIKPAPVIKGVLPRSASRPIEKIYQSQKTHDLCHEIVEHLRPCPVSPKKPDEKVSQRSREVVGQASDEKGFVTSMIQGTGNRNSRCLQRIRRFKSKPGGCTSGVFNRGNAFIRWKNEMYW